MAFYDTNFYEKMIQNEFNGSSEFFMQQNEVDFETCRQNKWNVML